MEQENLIGCILCEETSADVEFKVKSENKNGFIIAEGILQQGNEINRNRRYYPTEELRASINSPRTKELVESGNLKGEAGHPTDTSLARQAKVDPTLEQVWYQKLWMDGDFVMGNFKGSNLPIGEAFDQDLRDGMLPAWSLRALGTVENTNRGAEVKGVKIITYDRVYYPSHPEAYTTKVLSESAIIDSNGNPFKTPVPESSKDKKICEEGLVVPVVNQQVIDYIQQESCNFKQICNEFEVFYDDISLIENGTKVQLSNSKTGNVFIVSLESYIHNEIMDYCSSHR